MVLQLHAQHHRALQRIRRDRPSRRKYVTLLSSANQNLKVQKLTQLAVVMGSPIANIYIGEISTASLGMKVEIWDQDGKNIEDSGKEGDLIITKPFFSMPVTFWGPGGEEKYRKAYFEQFPGVWCHGDYIRKNPATGGYEILGRSDGMLNPGGRHLN
jgi:acyl-coenzyme A synthetase/AMP-(fatty) acid ligase